MPRKSNKKPSFFKVLIHEGFPHLLRLPPAFLRKHELNPPENAKIRVHSGRKWDVKVEKIENGGGLICFTDGWTKFAEDVSLQIGEFLVFTLIAKSEFLVNIYNTSFCEREITPTTHPSHGSHVNNKTRDDVVGKPRTTSSEKRSPLYFEISPLQPQHQSRISLPKEFSVGARMYERKDVKVEYVANKYCETILLDPRKWRIDLAKGWPKFRKENGLEYGRTYSFEFKPNENAIHVKEVKKSV